MRNYLLGLLGLFHCVATLAAEPVTLYSYQQKPPYVLEGPEERGLYADLTQQLNARLPEYVFEVRQIPRRRLDRLLSLGKLDGVVLGANPAWFPSSPELLWTEPFIEDANVLVSRAAGPDSHLNLSDLGGRQLGIVAGHHYPELKQHMPHDVVVQEGVSEKTNLELLQRGRIDATIIGVSTLDYYRQHEPALGARLYVLAAPLNHYYRHLMVPARYASLVPKLNNVINALRQDPAWQRQVDSYR